MYYQGDGVPRNLPAALAWWQQAAGQGHAESLLRLAQLAHAGKDVPMDLDKAAQLRRAGCRLWPRQAIARARRNRLVAEMKVPGRAWLQFEVEPDGEGGSTIRQTAIFDPAGIVGLAYWYTLWPVHDYIFGGMLRRIAAASAAA